MKIKLSLLTLLLFSTLTSFSEAGELIVEQDRALPLVYISVVFKGGATQDPDGKNGLTDIMGKFMLRGTKLKTKNQIFLALDQLGASLGFETRAEFIALRGAVLSENLKPFLELLSEIITSPSFRSQELEKLKKEEISSLLDELGQDRDLIKLRFDQYYFKGHPFSKSNSGRIKDIQNLTVPDLTQHYAKLINDSQMILLASGDAHQDDFKNFMREIHEKRNNPAQLNLLSEFTHHPQKNKVVIFDKPERTQTQVLIAQKGISFNDPKLDALQLANYAFGGGSFNARLMMELRVKRGWTYGAGSGFKLGNQAHTWRMSFFPKNSDTPAAIKEALHLVKELKDKGLTQAEFDFAKQSLTNSAGFSFNTPSKRLENKLIEIIYHLPENYQRNFASRLQKLTLPNVNQALKDFLTPDQMLIGLVATSKTSKSDIAKTLGINEKEIDVQDYQKE